MAAIVTDDNCHRNLNGNHWQAGLLELRQQRSLKVPVPKAWKKSGQI
jgi:hypothetical protein